MSGPPVPNVPDDTPLSQRPFLAALRQAVMNLLGQSGDSSIWAVKRGELSSIGVVNANFTTAGTPAQLTLGNSVGYYPPDTSAEYPTDISGLTVSSLFAGAYVSWNQPTYTQALGHSHCIVYSATGAAATFASAQPVGTSNGTAFADPGNLGVTRRYWVKAVAKNGNIQVNPTGPADITIGLVGNANLGPQIIQASNMAAGSITPANFLSGTNPVFFAAALPTLPSATYPQGTLVVLTTTNKVYRSTGSTWTTAQDGADITANSIVAGQVGAGGIVAGTITAASGVIANAAIQNAMIDRATANKLQVVDSDIITLNAGKITTGSLAVGQNIQSTGFTAGSTGWQITGNGAAEFGSVAIRDVLTLRNNQITLSSNGALNNAGGGAVTINGLGSTGVFGSGNLCVNSDFLLYSGVIPTGFGGYGAPGITGSVPAAGGPIGNANYWRITQNTTGANPYGPAVGFSISSAAAQFGGWKANTNYVFSVYVRCSAAQSFGCSHTWNSGTAPGTLTVLQNPNLTTGWQRYSTLINFGNGALDTQLFFGIASAGVSVPAGVYADFACLQVEQGDAPSGWAPPSINSINPVTSSNVSTFIANAAIQNAQIANLDAGKITTGLIVANQIDGRNLTIKDAAGNVLFGAAQNLDWSRIVASGGWLNSNVSLASNGVLSGAAAGSAVTIPGLGSTGVFGSGNLCANSDFLLTAAGGAPNTGTGPVGYSVYNNAGVATTSTIGVNTGAVAPANRWNIICNAAGATNFGWFFSSAATSFGGWKAVTNYVVSFYAAGTGNLLNSTFYAAWNQNPQTVTWIQNPSLTTTWQRYVCLINFGTNPIDTQGFFSTSRSPASGDYLILSCIQVEQGDAPSGWAPPSINSINPVTSSNVSTFIANAAIQNAQIANLDAGKITTGLIVANQIDGRNLTIKDANGTVVFSSGTAVGNDSAASLGFNPTFSAWSGTLPDGWSAWAGPNPGRETSIVLGSPYSVRYSNTADTGIQRQVTFPSPMPAGSFLTGSFSMYVISNAGGGKPGYLFRLFTNAALTTYTDNIIPITDQTVSGWQKMPFTATCGGAAIYGMQVFQMASWSGMPGGNMTNGSVVCFGPLAFDFNTKIDNSVVNPAANWLNGNVTINANGTLSGAGAGAVTVAGLDNTVLRSANPITSGNITTYISGAAIGTAQIANAAIGAAQIAGASITNAQIANATILGANIANAAIGTAQIANAAIGTAQIAGASITNAQIANATILGANIANLAVDTLQVANNAITIPVTSYTAGALGVAIGAQTAQSASITVGASVPVTLLVGFNYTSSTGSDQLTINLLRGSTSIYTVTVGLVYNTGYTLGTITLPPLLDTPGAGTFTYSITVAATTNGNVSVSARSIVLLATKK